MDDDVKFLSDEIQIKALKEAEYHPIDRVFLGQYIDRLLAINPSDFVLYNIEQVNQLYSVTLFSCLPEIWEQLDMNDLEALAEQFTNPFSFYMLIEFSYKYLAINILEYILEWAAKKGWYEDIASYLSLQWNVIIMSDEEKYENEFGVFSEFLKYDSNAWNYIKQKFLLDRRAIPAIQDPTYLHNYVHKLLKNI